MTHKTCRSNIGSSRYHEKKTSKNDLWQSARSTNFENWLGMSHNLDKLVQIRVMGFLLMFQNNPKTCLYDIGNLRVRGKTLKKMTYDNWSNPLTSKINSE